MKKKLVAGALLSAVMLSGCGNLNNASEGTLSTHTHVAFGDIYDWNGTEHWQTCECGEKIAPTPHTVGENMQCTECGLKMDNSSIQDIDKETNDSAYVAAKEVVTISNMMSVGQIDQDGHVYSTVAGFNYTPRIKLNASKSFRFFARDTDGVLTQPALRYITAYDSDGTVLPQYSRQNIEQAGMDDDRVITMDTAVDSVVITLLGDYVEESVILEGTESVSSAISVPSTDLGTSFSTVFTLDELRYGNYKNGIADYSNGRAICTNDYVKPFVSSVSVRSDEYRMAVVVYSEGAYVRTDAWITSGTLYIFDHNAYEYHLYFARVDGEYIYDMDACRNAIELTMSTEKILQAYNALEASSRAEQNHIEKTLENMMRRNYDITYANASAPINLTTYVGNNQIVHPKVLYFPDKFGGHRFWMAYTPYPFADGAYENPCIAYSDDGYEWTNIPGNPLDDPGGVDVGVNTDTHLVYNETTATLEVWWRYEAKDIEPNPEIIYRKVSTDGLNWTEKEVVINNETGDHVRYLSPCILYDGSKYKVWAVNSSDNTINYYEGTSATALSKVRDITLPYQDGDTAYRLWHIDVIEDNGKTVLLAMCKGNTNLTQKEQSWSLFLATSDDNITFSTPTLVMAGNPYGWDKQLYRSSIVNVDGEYRIYYSAQDEKQRHGLGISTSDKLSEFVGMIN